MKQGLEKLKEQIENYKLYNEQEEKDKEIMLQYLNNFDNVLTRENEFGHFTASAWAVNKERTNQKRKICWLSRTLEFNLSFRSR